MTKAKLVFNPFSQDYFDDPYEMYRRMRDEAPVYYNEEHDFYALTRHEDVAAAFKDHETFSSRSGATSSVGAACRRPRGMKSIIFMDPPDHRHMRSLLNKAFTPRAIQAQKRDGDRQPSSTTSARPIRTTSTSCRTSRRRFPSRSSPGWPVCPRTVPQQVRHWIDKGLHREAGPDRARTTTNMQANIDSGDVLLRPGAGAAGEPAGRHDQPADRRGDPRARDGGLRKLDDIEITGFTSLLGGAGAETVTKLVGSAVVEFAQHPEQWQKLLDDRSKIPAAVEELLRYVGPVQYNVRYSVKDVRPAQRHDSRRTNRSS